MKMEKIQDCPVSDFDFLDSSSGDEASGPVNTRAYSVESLIRELGGIHVIRENLVRHREKNQVEIKLEKIYSLDPEWENLTPDYCVLTETQIKKTCGLSDREREILLQSGYLKTEGKSVVLTRLFVVCSPEDFHIGLTSEREKEIYRKLDQFLWQSVPQKRADGAIHPVWQSLFNREEMPRFYSLSDREGYVFRFGNTVFVIDFHDKPSPELLELIRLKIALINQERLQNFFQIISMYSADVGLWFKKDKKAHFFEICGNLLNYSWRPFDMEECLIAFSGTRGPYSFANGSLQYRFNWDGEPSWSMVSGFNGKEIAGKPSEFEFSNRSIQVTLNKETIEPITMDVYFKSRSGNNVDPQKNLLLHGYLKFLSETIGKLIDLIIPIIQMERSEESLKWKTFFDRLRIRAMGYGEDIDRILTDSAKVLKWFFSIQDVSVFMENRELLKMTRIYQAQNKFLEERPYRLLETSIVRNDIYRNHYVPFYFNEEPGEQIIVYLRYAVADPKGEYLNGTEFLGQIQEGAEKINYGQIREAVLLLFASALSYNPTISISNFFNKWKGRTKKIPQNLVALAQRIFTHYAVFFDLLVSLHANLESGISRMRASRDRLTGLYNRQSFSNVLEKFASNRNHSFGLMFIDMDSFKIYNDAISHHFGDKVLIGLSEMLLAGGYQILFPSISGRFGGDEFCFAVNNISEVEFELVAVKMFKLITGHEFDISFSFDNCEEPTGFDINFISFMYRIIRPDVGGRGDEIIDFVEKAEDSPRGYILHILKHYSLTIEDPELNRGIEELLFKNKTSENHLEGIINFLFRIAAEKLLRNHILKEIDDSFEKAIRLFLRYQLDNRSTDMIREDLVRELECHQLVRKLSLRISAGLAHSKEYRLRSVSSLFKAADNRAYLSKHNGKNCLFSIDNKRLV